MKKAIVLLLAAVICTGLTACNTGNTEISQETVSQTETVVEEDKSFGKYRVYGICNTGSS